MYMDLPSCEHTIDEQLISKFVRWIQSNCKKSTKVIIYMSGTINSIVASVLFKKALGDKILVIIFDFDTSKTENLVNISKNLGLATYILNRGHAYQTALAAYKLHKEEDIRKLYQRFVNYHLQTAAEHMKAEVVDLEDKSSRLLNPRLNDFYGSLMPFYSFYKSELYNLAKYLNLSFDSTNSDYWEKMDPVLNLLEKQEDIAEIASQFNIDINWLKMLKKRLEKQTLESPVSQFIV